MTVEPHEDTRQITLRLPTSILDRLESYASNLRGANVGWTVSRADVIRLLLHEGLSIVEGKK